MAPCSADSKRHPVHRVPQRLVICTLPLASPSTQHCGTLPGNYFGSRILNLKLINLYKKISALVERVFQRGMGKLILDAGTGQLPPISCAVLPHIPTTLPQAQPHTQLLTLHILSSMAPLLLPSSPTAGARAGLLATTEPQCQQLPLGRGWRRQRGSRL